jgi:hypothetical protein
MQGFSFDIFPRSLFLGFRPHSTPPTIFTSGIRKGDAYEPEAATRETLQ